jgi:hypothetical protein
MAEMIPETLPASSTAGERRVFATLGRLPDDCLIYYEPVVRRRYPDLIAILPEVGVLVIEVKDWRLAELGSVEADTVTITRRGTATVVQHPRAQARGYMLRLMDECRRHPQVGMLIQKRAVMPAAMPSRSATLPCSATSTAARSSARHPN